ncbi:hypothetical protein CTEN210_04505 [Chaetoceros tenuissimus]|uniref:MYND-type domain-containing protein n=1 Tax=Chaetoceros tenuissimus TaxID=426638 RepID=A0AAD3CNQ5_9STRA|nr:hypothetical protein CTEN210_04505 [Chaetoceros tenuissimus]
MPSTEISENPNDGSCAACNKEGAVLQCAPCRDAGVDVFFCNSDCQVKLWKTHKDVCKKSSNGNPKKEVSNANKEAKAERKKGRQLRKDSQNCDNCSKTGVDIGSKLSVCSKCNSAYYCSRECQVEHWPTHKKYCKHNSEIKKNVESSLDSSREVNIYNLFEKWVGKTSSMSCFSNAVYHALKKKGVEQQPPVKAVRIEIEFNYNAQTFVVAEEPRAVAIADLHQTDKEMIRKILKEKPAKKIDQVYNHFVFISTKELGTRCFHKISIGITKSELDQMNAIDIDMFLIRNISPQVRLKSNLFRGWKSIRRNNLQKQMEQMNLGQSYTAFVQNALQFFCNKSLQNTHRIVVYTRMGKEIGQISQLLHYQVVSIAEFKEYKEDIQEFVIHVGDIESRSLPCTDMAIETLFTDSNICFGFDHTVLCAVNVIQNKSPKQCKKAADKHFRKLQKSVKEMPSDLLEKVSL